MPRIYAYKKAVDNFVENISLECRLCTWKRNKKRY